MALVRRRCVLLRLSDRYLLLRSVFSKLFDFRMVWTLGGRHGEASISWMVGRSNVNLVSRSNFSNFGGEPASTGLNSGRAVEVMDMGHDIRVLSCSGPAVDIFSEEKVEL
jgi:hypothetical protein